jgi:hypothetical protein
MKRKQPSEYRKRAGKLYRLIHDSEILIDLLLVAAVLLLRLLPPHR